MKDYDRCIEIIQSAYPNDHAEIIKFFNEDFISSFDDLPSHIRNFKYCGVYGDGILAGFGAYALSFLTDSVWELGWGTVHQDYQGRGCGKALLDYRIAAILERKKSDDVYVTVHSKASTLFLEAGFSPMYDAAGKSVMSKKVIV